MLGTKKAYAASRWLWLQLDLRLIQERLLPEDLCSATCVLKIQRLGGTQIS